jgi:hypothetical protein
LIPERTEATMSRLEIVLAKETAGEKQNPVMI